MADVLHISQLKKLSQHKYSATGTSLIEPFMQVFWRWVVEQIPLWWAPNAITLVGLIINVVTTFILIAYSPDARHEPPGFAFVLVALGLFVYQCLDAIDGKQARRTKTATPLGELFDHGCDSVSTVFVIIGISISLQLGMSPGLLFFECFAAMFMFYAAHWQTYCSGTLKFGLIDVTEGQFTVIGVYLLTGVLGPSFWAANVPLLGCELKMFPVCFSIFASLLACRNYFSIILFQGGVGKHGSTVAGSSVLSPLLPISGIIVLAFVIWQKSPSHVYENHPLLYIISFGMVASKITNKLVIAHMTKSEMEYLDSSLIGPLLLFLNQYFNILLNEYFVLWMCFFYCTADLLRYSYYVCLQICTYLDISCFKITPPTKSKTTENHNDSATPPSPHAVKSRVLENLDNSQHNSSSHAGSGSGSDSSDYSRPVTRQSSKHRK